MSQREEHTQMVTEESPEGNKRRQAALEGNSLARNLGIWEGGPILEGPEAMLKFLVSILKAKETSRML